MITKPKPILQVLNKIKKIAPYGFILILFIHQGYLLRQIALFAPKYTDRPVGPDGSTYYFQFLGLQDGSWPVAPFEYFPLYPYFLDFLHKIFNYPIEYVFVPYLVQNFLVFLTCAFTYKIGKWLFSENIGVLSCFGVIFYDRLLDYTFAYASEIPSLFLLTGALYFMLLYAKKNSWIYLGLTSLFLGGSALGRATSLTLVGAFIVWRYLLKIPFKKIITDSVIMVCIILVLLLPAIWHNYQTSSSFSFITTTGPINLFIGNNSQSQGQYYFPSELASLITPDQSTYIYLRDVVDYIIQQPVPWSLLQIRKLQIFLTFPWWRVGYLFTEPSLGWNIFWLSTSVIYALVYFATFTRDRAILHFALLFYVLATVVFFVEERFRLPLLPIMFIFTSVSLIKSGQYIVCKLKRFNVLKLVLGLAVAIMIILRSPHKIGQAIGEINTPTIYGGMTIGQSFRPNCSGLYRIDVKMRTNNPEIIQPLSFHLREGTIDGPELYSKNFTTQHIRRANYTSFVFPEIPDSINKQYVFFFDTAMLQSPENGLIVLIEPDTPIDTVEDGTVLLNGQHLPGDLTFFAYCLPFLDW